jgi:glycosyltransferase
MINPKITIITCTFNSATNLRDTLESVKKQSYQNFEHLFIDGGSSDKTLEIIKEYYASPVMIIGQDKSLYDAFNKGLENASGQIVGFLHSDDALFDDRALERIAASFANDEIDYYCSRMEICDQKLEIPFALLGAAPHKQTFKDQLYSSTYFAHPTYYCKKEITQQVGKFNLKYKVAADIDWLYRLEQITNRFYFDRQILVKFRGEGGLSAGRYFTGLKEEFFIRLKTEKFSPTFYLVYGYHFLRRIVRFILEKFGLFGLIKIARKTILKLKK